MIADPHEGPRTTLRVVPVTLDVANAFVERMHRHSDPTQGHRWSIGDKADAGGEASNWHNRDGRKVGTRKRLPPEADLVGGKWRWVA